MVMQDIMASFEYTEEAGGFMQTVELYKDGIKVYLAPGELEVAHTTSPLNSIEVIRSLRDHKGLHPGLALAAMNHLDLVNLGGIQ